MKQVFFLIYLPLLNLSAQAPKNYYTKASGKGYQLKSQLHNIIKKHKDLGYGGLWQTYKTSDLDIFFEKDNSVLDIYSENPKGKDPYSYKLRNNQCGIYSDEGDCYNREHIIPQSSFNSASPMVSDAHFIPPTDGKVNGMRSSYPHGEVSKTKWTSKNGSKLGTSKVNGYKGIVFEPIDEFKGDIARMYFYFATRYEDKVAKFNYEMFNGTRNQVFTDAFKNLLLKWHKQDPVSDREILRNNAIYKRQGNRNPFIDHPEFVNLIWNETKIDKDKIKKEAEKTIVKNVQIKTKTQSEITIEKGKEIYFLMYIEGSKNNKGLVVYNPSSKSIDLSHYTIKKQTNGKGIGAKGLNLMVI